MPRARDCTTSTSENLSTTSPGSQSASPKITRQELVSTVFYGVRYLVDVKEGQKTGFFLDQKYNRKAIHPLCRNAKVLDCFTHTGSFALNAGIAGADSVLGVDASQLAVTQAEENAALNGLSDRVKFVCADVFELLPELERRGEAYDMDSPATSPDTPEKYRISNNTIPLPPIK
mgnify:CR=1 FL=1